MSSLEMVSYINSTRKAGEAEVRHASFLKKVPEVLKGGEQKFLSSYKSAQNKTLPMYNFAKREAILMEMSYSYELQAQIFDAWESGHQNCLDDLEPQPCKYISRLLYFPLC